MATCGTQRPVVPTEGFDAVQSRLAQMSSSNEIDTLPGSFSPIDVLRLPTDIVQLAASRHGPKERNDRLQGSASLGSTLRVPSYQIVQLPEAPSTGSKEIESLSGVPFSKPVVRVLSWSKVSNAIHSEDQNDKEYVSIADLVKYNRSESGRSNPTRPPLKNSILEKACSAYLQAPVRKKGGFCCHFWQMFREFVGKVFPISCFTGSSDPELDRLVDSHNLDKCENLFDFSKLD